MKDSCNCQEEVYFNPQLTDCRTIRNRSRREKDHIISSLSSVTKEPVSLLHWGGAYSDEMVKTQTFELESLTEDLRTSKKFYNHNIGLRLSDSLSTLPSWQGHRSRENGSLLKVVVKTGMRFVDLTEKRILDQFMALGLTLNDLFYSNRPILIKFKVKDHSQWIAKDPRSLEISYVTGENETLPQLLEMENQSKNSPYLHRALQRQLKNSKRSFFLEISDTGPLAESEKLKCRRQANFNIASLIPFSNATYLWHYDGHCASYRKGKFPRRVIKDEVDKKYCRERQGSFHRRSGIGICQELALNDDRIVIESNAEEKGKIFCRSPLYCTPVQSPHEKGPSYQIRTINLQGIFNSRGFFFDDLETCRKAAEINNDEKSKKETYPFTCVFDSRRKIKIVSHATGDIANIASFPSFPECQKSLLTLPSGFICKDKKGYFVKPLPKNIPGKSDNYSLQVFNQEFADLQDCLAKMKPINPHH